MIRIAGVSLPENKNAVIALSYVAGIGETSARKILKQVGLAENLKLSQIEEQKIEQIRGIIENDYSVEGNLKVQIGQNIRRLKEIGAYRGTRHARNLPVRGQRTKTNGRTKRGKKVTVGSGRKKAAEKT